MRNEANDIPEFSEESFWGKLSRKVVKACRDVAEKAVTLYYCMIDRDTPTWAKTKIAGALGYLVLPVDAIPDAVPVVGYTDDAAVLALAFATVVMHIKPEHMARARKFIQSIIGKKAKNQL